MVRDPVLVELKVRILSAILADLEVGPIDILGGIFHGDFEVAILVGLHPIEAPGHTVSDVGPGRHLITLNLKWILKVEFELVDLVISDCCAIVDENLKVCERCHGGICCVRKESCRYLLNSWEIVVPVDHN